MANESLVFSAGVAGIESSVDRAWNNVNRKKYLFRPTLDASKFGLKDLNEQFTRFNSSLSNATNRVVGFASAGAVVYGVTRAFREFIKSTIDTEQSLARINVNLGLTKQQLAQFSRGLFDTARATGQSFDNVAKAAEEFARQGLSVAETQKRTRDALMLSRIAAIDSAEAVRGLTAATNTFSKEALNTTQILDRLAAVDTRFAVSSRDLNLAISRVGNSAQEAGVSFNQLLAIVTALQQTTQRGGSIIGNSLKTIFTRISRPEVLDQLEKLGIGVRDVNNEIVPGIQLIQNLASKYDLLGQSEKSHVAELVGGVYQINILKAAVADLSKQYSIYSQALQVAGNAEGAASQKNAELNKTLATTINAVGNSLKELFASVGNQSLGPFLKTLLGGFEQLRDHLSKDQGLGQAIGQGLLKGLTNFVSGPLFLGVFAIVFKTLRNVVSQYVTIGRQELGILSVSERRQGVLDRINVIMKEATAIEQRQILNSATVLQQAEAILKVEQRIARTRLAANAENAALSNVLIAKGFEGGPRGRRAAGGYLPVHEEQSAISKGVGGVSGNARPVVIPNFAYGGGTFGPIVANSEEYLVKNYANGGSAIFNPSMVKAYGLPAGAQKIGAAGGYVPNFAVGPIGLRRGALQVGEGAFARFLKGEGGIGFKAFNADGEQSSLIRGEFAISKLAEELGLPVAKVFGTAKRAVAREGIYKEYIDGTLGRELRPDIRSAVSATLRAQYREKGIEPTDLHSGNFIVRKGANLNDPVDVWKNSVVIDPGAFTVTNGDRARSFNRHYYSSAGGYIPNLAAAISREISAGVPPSSVYVGSDSRVASAGNPAGLLVANRRDEPLGGFQGVNRVLGSGGNPRNAGAASGWVPNFADFKAGDLQSRSIYSGTFEPLRGNELRKLNRLFKTIRNSGDLQKIESAFEELHKIAENVDKPSYKKLQSLLSKEYQSFSSRRSIFRSGYNAFGERATQPNIPAQIEAQEPGVVGNFGTVPSPRRKSVTSVLPQQSKFGKFLGSSGFQLGLVFGAPLLAGGVDAGSTSLGFNKGGTAGGVLTGALSGGLQGAGSGAIFGEVGAGVGAVIGAFVGGISKATKSSEEFATQLSKQSTLEKNRLDEVSQYVQLQSAYNDALQSGNFTAAKNFSSQQGQILRSARPETLQVLRGVNATNGDQIVSDLAQAFSANEVRRRATISTNSLTDLSKRIFGVSKQDISGVANDITSAAITSGFNLNRADTKFGGKDFDTDISKLQVIFNRMGVDVEVTRGNFINLVKALNEAKDSYAKSTTVIDDFNAKAKEAVTAQTTITDLLRKASLADFSRSTALSGRIERRQFQANAYAREFEGLATPEQNIGLQGQFAIQSALDQSAQQQSAIDQDTKDKIRGLLRGSKLTPDQRETAFSGYTSLTDLTNLAKQTLPGDEQLNTILKDAALATQKLKVATDENVKTLRSKTETEQSLTETLRRQTAFSNYTPESAARGISNLPRFGANLYNLGYSVDRAQNINDQALIQFADTAKGFGANLNPLRELLNGANARNNRQNFLKFAAQSLGSLPLYNDRPGVFKNEFGDVTEGAIRNAARQLSGSTSERYRSIGKFFLTNLDAENANLKGAGSAQGRINAVLNNAPKGVSELDTEADKSLKAAEILSKTFAAFDKKQADFSLTLNVKAQIALDNIDRFQSKEAALQFQKKAEEKLIQLGQEIYKLKGTPMPPTTDRLSAGTR